jgi:hypothetical protein
VVGLVGIRVPHVGIIGSLLAFVLVQLGALALAWMRCARLFTLVAAMRS